MRGDQHGNDTTVASDQALAAYDAAVDHLLHFRSQVADAVDEAIELDPGFAMAHIMRAYLGMLGTEPDDVAAARRQLDAYEATADVQRLGGREQAHLAAARALLRGDLFGGGRSLRAVTADHPRDALALAVGHQVDFFTADAVALRDRIGGALDAWGPDDPHYGPVLGMYAFGLEESGLYSRARDVGQEAVERDAADVWGIHAVAHTYEMHGGFSSGLGFLDARAPAWQQGNFLNVHNWWHYCLYLLEAGDVPGAVEIYDAVLHNAASAGVAMEMLDAAALLWRLHLEGIDQYQRWTVLASAWDAKTATPHYAFNDMHAVMAYVGAGRLDDAETLVRSRERYVAEATGATEASGPTASNIAMTREVGLPVAAALIAFGREDYARTVELLAPIRNSVNRFGGSHAQRDAVQRTLLEAALRSGRHQLARTLVSERLGVNPCSPYSWLKRAAVAEAVGDGASAARARASAARLREAAGRG